jgi:hypothetical protein
VAHVKTRNLVNHSTRYGYWRGPAGEGYGRESHWGIPFRLDAFFMGNPRVFHWQRKANQETGLETSHVGVRGYRVGAARFGYGIAGFATSSFPVGFNGGRHWLDRLVFHIPPLRLAGVTAEQWIVSAQSLREVQRFHVRHNFKTMPENGR